MELNSKSETLPAGAQNADAEFAKIVDESKTRIAEATPAPGVPRRGRGRPPKARPTMPTPAPIASGAPVVGSAPPDLSQFIQAPLMAISKIPAEKHHIPALALTADEAGACAQALNACLNAFVPNMEQMSPQSAAVIGLCTTVGAIGFQKYQIYSIEMAKRELEKPVQETPTQPKTQSAGDFFPQVRVG